MPFVVKDRVRETSVTTGTGEYTLAGAPTGYQAFSAIGNGNTCPYFATDNVNWEVGIGTYVTGPTRLQRTTVLDSSNGGAAVNWGAGTRDIICGLPAARAVMTNADNTFTGTNTFSGSGGVSVTGGDLSVARSASGSAVSSIASNTDNTNGASHAFLLSRVGGASGGDPVIQLEISGVQGWSAGIDNSDSDKFKIGPNSAVGTSTALEIPTGGGRARFFSELAVGNLICSGEATTDAFTVGFTNSNGPGLLFWGTASGGTGQVQLTIAGAERFGVDGSGRIKTGAASVATGFTSAGDITLPVSGAIRSRSALSAWVRHDNAATPNITRALNVGSVTKNATGDYSANITASVMADGSYGYHVTGRKDDSNTQGPFVFGAPTATVLRYRALNGVGSAVIDLDEYTAGVTP